MAVTYTITKELTKENLNDLMANAFEGGIGYWACLNNDTPTFERYYETTNLCTTDIVSNILWDGGYVELIGVEDEGYIWQLSLAKVLKGLKMNASERPYDADWENGDSITADCIIQYGLFDDLIFG